MIKHSSVLVLLGMVLSMTQCVPVAPLGKPNMAGPPAEAREAAIANEPTGDFFYGRRYVVNKTRFWGYLREPRQPWKKARLVMMKEDKMLVPDRLPEEGTTGKRYGYDANYDYRIEGYYTGSTAYDPNSNQELPVFMLTGYELLDEKPGWLFRPDDHYDSSRFTLYPR